MVRPRSRALLQELRRDEARAGDGAAVVIVNNERRVSATLTRSASSILGLGVATIACTIGLGTTGAAAHNSLAFSPNRLPKIATGVARVSVRSCNGPQRSSGTAFLIGERVVMTAREVIESVRGCRAVHVFLSGKAYRGERIIYWSTGGKRDDAVADVATLKLSSNAPGFVFSFARRTPTLSTTIAVVGYPPGKPLSFNQGPLIAARRVEGVPVAVVKLLAGGGASGSAFLDPAGAVVGIAQTGLAPGPGKETVVTQRKGVVWGVNLVRWWGPAIARDLCRAYPNGGTPGCKPPAATATATAGTGGGRNVRWDDDPEREGDVRGAAGWYCLEGLLHQLDQSVLPTAGRRPLPRVEQRLLTAEDSVDRGGRVVPDRHQG